MENKMTVTLRFVKEVKKILKDKLREESKLDECWDLVADKEVVEEEIITSEEFYKQAQKITNQLWASVVDEVTYEKRQLRSEIRAKQRSEQLIDASLKPTSKEITKS